MEGCSLALHGVGLNVMFSCSTMLWDDILRYAMLCYAVLICHAMLCYVMHMLCNDMICNATLRYANAMLYYIHLLSSFTISK